MGSPSPKLSLRSVVASYPLPFIVIDENYEVIAANDAFRRRYDIHRENLLGRHCYELSHGNDRPCHELGEDCPYQRVHESGQPYSCVHIHRDDRGVRYRVRVTVHPLEGEDGRRLLGESMEVISPLTETAGKTGPGDMVGNAPAFLDAKNQLLLAARSDFPVLLLGETGTGKELAAGFIHRNSYRADGPYLTLDCTTVTENLFEAEVFGHERGAFTGSVGEKAGLFELADGGTLFLDEIGELSANSQAKLLRALEKGEFRRVGGQRTRHSDVRVICATNRHLWELVENTRFREDLYYRIACLTVHLPALRERREDIPALAQSFLTQLPRVMGQYPHITDEAIDLLSRQSYPGNIRQLRNVVYAAAAQSLDGCIDASDVEMALRIASGNSGGPRQDSPGAHEALPDRVDDPRGLSLAELERSYTVELLKELNGNRRAVAERLGISTRTLYRRLKRYGLR